METITETMRSTRPTQGVGGKEVSFDDVDARPLAVSSQPNEIRIGRLTFHRCRGWLKVEVQGEQPWHESEGELLDGSASQALLAWLNN